jgi:hypothetical protein
MISDDSIREYKTAIGEATTQAKLALLAYSLLGIIEGEQRRAKWNKMKAERPTSTPRSPAVGDLLQIESRCLTICEVACEGPFDQVTVKADETSFPTFGIKRVTTTEVNLEQIELKTVLPTKAEWRLKRDAICELKVVLTRRATRKS